jgi:energy-coupling factor transporter transmembrane protein EcfT
LRVLPVYIYEFAVAVVIATSVLPQIVTSVKRIRMAQRLRGQSTKGFTSWKRVAIPLLEESLARSLDLAAAMDSRGYGVSKKRSRYRPISWRLKDSLVVASALCVLVIS